MGPQAKGCRQLGKRGSGPCPGSSRRRTDSPAATVWTSDFQNCTIIFFFFFFKARRCVLCYSSRRKLIRPLPGRHPQPANHLLETLI